ncbi:menaquinone-dependent protoporphyrinogen oxidase [Streptomyces sp. TLI_235]|nr:flavodoxin domain-containing protein [Streptomyces sp. TLI_235]PBC75856.1 menaquinone-dependent protoporphyrinogen oxidase [Streptomyces sp. TLI_235]
MRVFIGYAGVHGSTRGVAERLAAALRRHEHKVVLASLAPGVDVHGFDVLVIGSAVHDGRWLPEAAEFVRQNTDELARRRVWLFSVSLLGDRGSAFRPGMARRLRRMRSRHSHGRPVDLWTIKPLGHRDFAGAVAREHWPLVGRVVFRAMGGRFGDHRDWADIDDWAERIASSLTTEDRET